jgi:hypothetical protein
MELSPKQIMETGAYLQQKEVIHREINYGDPKNEYFADRKIFEHTKEERKLLYHLKHKWREEIRLQGYTKRNVPTGVNGSI